MSLQSARSDLLHRGWLGHTPAWFRDAVMARVGRLQLTKGMPIYHAGDDSAGLFGIAKGSVRVAVFTATGEPEIGDLLPAGSWVGDAAFVTRQPRRIGVSTAESSEILTLRAADLQAIVDQDKEAWHWLALLNVLSLDRAMRVGVDLMVRDPHQRLTAVIARLAAEFDGRPRAGQVTIHVGQEDLARMANVSRTFLGEHLRALEAAGTVQLGYGTITLPDPRRLTGC